MMNMSLLAVVTPPSIYQILKYKISIFRLITFWQISWQIKHLIKPIFLSDIEINSFRNNEIRDFYFKACLIRSYHFLCVMVYHEKYWTFLRINLIAFRWCATACVERRCIRCFSDILWVHNPGVMLNIRLNKLWWLIL